MDLPADNTPPAADAPACGEAAPLKAPGVWSGLGTVALYFLLQLGLSMLVGALVGMALGIEAGIRAARVHQKLDTTTLFATLQGNPEVRVIVTALTIAAAAAVMALLVRQTWPGQWSRAALPGFGFAQPRSKLAYPGAVLLGIAVLLLGGAMTHLLAGSHPLDQDIAAMARQVSVGMRLWLVVLVVCVAPFVEELVFRGVLLSGLASRMPVGWAIVISALVFGCAHLPDFGFAWYGIPTLVLLGLALGWIRIRSGSLWPAIVLHATNNVVAAAAWFMVAHP